MAGRLKGASAPPPPPAVAGLLWEDGVMTGRRRVRTWRIEGRAFLTDEGLPECSPPRGGHRGAIAIDLPTARLVYALGSIDFAIVSSAEEGGTHRHFTCELITDTERWVRAIRAVQRAHAAHGRASPATRRRSLHVETLPLVAGDTPKPPPGLHEPPAAKAVAAAATTSLTPEA